MFDKLRQVIIALNMKAQQHSLGQNLRRLLAMTLRSKDLVRDMRGIMDIAARFDAEVSSWISPEDIAGGKGGRFDACDLRHWLALCQRANVPFVPAKVVLKLTDAELSMASGQISVPKHYSQKLSAKLKTAVESMPELQDAELPMEETVDAEALEEKLFAAMDDVPEGYMVRHVRCGPSTLKALAGAGAAGPEAPETRFGPDLEIGPGWVRNGNRRRIDAGDPRFVEIAAQGPDDSCYFVARPWVEASRWAQGEDPHRHGTRFAGKGLWPAEWRAFVEDGIVIGVSSYYAWCGSVTAENAAMAMNIRDLAQKIVDEAIGQRAIPSHVDVELLRDHPGAGELRNRFPRDGIACTLDFIETRDGPLFLEGGPAFTPAGGGHPCGFAGCERPEGVAFRLMDGIILADPKTWRETSRDGAILPWDEVEVLASTLEREIP